MDDRRHVGASFLPGLLLLSACSTVTLPAPPVPAKEAPRLPEPPNDPPWGYGRVVLDVVGERANAELLTSRTDTMAYVDAWRAFRHEAKATPLCRTPCTVDLPLGSHELRFVTDDQDKTGTDFVVAAPKTTVFRHAPGEVFPQKGGQMAGAAMIGVGAPLAVIGGLVVVASQTSDKATDDAKTGAIIFTASSVGLFALGALMFVFFPPKFRPSSSVQWEVAR